MRCMFLRSPFASSKVSGLASCRHNHASARRIYVRFAAEGVSSKRQLRQVCADVLAQPPKLAALRTSLTALLEYLRGQGRTNANCWAVDFFMSYEGWEGDWTEQNLPDDFS